MKIDKFGLLPNHPLDIHPAADRNDFVSANGHRFRVGVLGLSRKDSGVVEDALDSVVAYHARRKQRTGNRQHKQRKIGTKFHPTPLFFRLMPLTLVEKSRRLVTSASMNQGE